VLAGLSFAPQVITVDVNNGINRDHFSSSKITNSPTIGFELIQPTLAVPQGSTLALGGLNLDIKARDQVTFPQGVPGLSDVPFIGGTLTQHRNPEISAQLIILITPKIVKSAEP
jgi:type II secretory pathway component GspD/PulD (secretin)